MVGGEEDIARGDGAFRIEGLALSLGASFSGELRAVLNPEQSRTFYSEPVSLRIRPITCNDMGYESRSIIRNDSTPRLRLPEVEQKLSSGNI
ncbi:hypothetical protein CEXT_32101 [Caerostris extrusa]|uniref:Uncharacterized protein n=1 Tax=Caerostris extrusa TaxID=172846 RepID=A0AAV4VGH8_CAEEX|nr:hypothetical protein CEXT_32101 [Caerostris extrusa]